MMRDSVGGLVQHVFDAKERRVQTRLPCSYLEVERVLRGVGADKVNFAVIGCLSIKSLEVVIKGF